MINKILIIVLSLNLIAISYGVFINYEHITNTILLFISTCIYVLTIKKLFLDD